MATRKCIKFKSPNRKSKFSSSTELHLHIGGIPFAIDRELLASKSAKVAALLKENPGDDFSHLLKDIPADAETFELVARFCHGYELNLSTENVFHVACLAHYLGMTENHSSNNLLKQALNFFENQILHSWNKSIRALKTAENILQQAVNLGLVDECVESIIRKVLENPCLLGEPFKNFTSINDSEDSENVFRPNVRRKLFELDCKSEDLTVMSLILYEPIIRAMLQRQVPVEFISVSVYKYAKRWVLSSLDEGDDCSIYKRNSQREIIEAVERFLPNERGLLPCKMLFEMLHSAIALDSSIECRNGLEVRIGKQLDQASVDDFLITFRGYAKEEQYDSECVKRILKIFYQNYTATDSSGLIAVAELVDKFLAEVATDIDLKMSTFLSIAELSIAASSGIRQTSDAIYRAIDIFLDKHRYLTESEREEVCKVLDCNKMSPEAREHAAQNARLPLRVVVQVLFVGQLKLRDAIPKEVQRGSDLKVLELEEEEEEKAAEITSSSEEEVKVEMEKMSNKVLELEKECYMMKRELQRGVCRRGKNEKVNVWTEMKRKFGCISSMQDCNSHVKKKKVHPRQDCKN